MTRLEKTSGQDLVFDPTLAIFGQDTPNKQGLMTVLAPCEPCLTRSGVVNQPCLSGHSIRLGRVANRGMDAARIPFVFICSGRRKQETNGRGI